MEIAIVVEALHMGTPKRSTKTVCCHIQDCKALRIRRKRVADGAFQAFGPFLYPRSAHFPNRISFSCPGRAGSSLKFGRVQVSKWKCRFVLEMGKCTVEQMAGRRWVV